jgi:hypothetical protein
MRCWPSRSNRRGATVAFMAVSLAALLAMVAIAVDVGMLLKVRSDAQRAADAAALAGAQEFMDGEPQVKKMQALNHALEYASRNYVNWKYVDTSSAIVIDSGAHLIANTPEAYVQVIPDTQKVRVFIRRTGTATWFAHLLHLDFIPISARAAAQASNAGVTKCVKPFAVPDIWNETNTTTQDKNGNRAWDTGEGWQFEPGNGDRYAVYDPSGLNLAQQTGYGSAWRNNNGQGVINDYGRLITIKAQRPGEAITSGFFYPWRMPMSDGTMAAGAADYRALLSDTTCTLAAPTAVGTPYRIEDGNMVGPTRQGVNDLLSYDPGAYWDPNYPDGQGHTGAVRGSKYADWRDSPRVMVLGLMDPAYIANIQGGGNLNFEFNNLALFFIEGYAGPADGYTGPPPQAPVKGRFLYWVHATASGPVVASLVKILQLVE